MNLAALAAGAVVIAAGTWLGFPVWAAIAGGAVAGLLGRERPALTGALAGAAAWGGLLVASWLAGNPVGLVARRLAGAMTLPGWAPVVLTLLLPALLGACAAMLVAGVAGPGRASTGRAA